MREETIIATSLARARFGRGWTPVLFFLILVTFPTAVGVLRPDVGLQEILASTVASALVGVIGWGFLRWEGVPAEDIGMGRRHWLAGFGLFAAWWVLLTAVDLVGRQVAAVFGVRVSALETLQWSPEIVLDWLGTWMVIGFAEEIAFRGYLHNKLVALCGRRWQGMALAAAAFGLWHIPGSILRGNTAVAGLLLGSLAFGLLSLLLFNLPYEWTGLLPFFALFHGWSDFPLLLTLQQASALGGVAGYILMFAALWTYRRLSTARGAADASA